MTQKLPIPISNGRPESEKRVQRPPGLIYHFGPFELDLDRYELRREGSRLRVPPAPLDLLTLLIQRRGVLVNREDIAARLWASPSMVDVDQGINTAIRRIREVLRDDPSAPRYLETVVGKGYRFIAEVKEVIPDLTPPAAPAQTQESAYRWKYLVAAIALVIILGAAYALWRNYQPKPLNFSFEQVTTNDSEQRVTAGAISPDGKWIAYADTSGISLRLLQSGRTVSLQAPQELRAERIAWFPDQTRILVSGFDPQFAISQIWMVSITGASPQLFRKDARNGVPSPDGTRIAFTANHNREVWTTGADGDNPRALFVDTSGKSFSSLFWSADGKRISYLRSLNGLGRDDKDDYESADASSGKVLSLEKNLTFESAVSLQDGRVFFLRAEPAGFRDAYLLWEVDTNAATGDFRSSPKRIASLTRGRPFGLTSSDDGTKMSIVLKTGQPHVYAAALRQPGPTLGEVQRLTFDTRSDYPGTWLHDNRTVLFESDRVGVFRLYQQQLQDPTARELDTGTGPAVLPQATPDGKWILFRKPTAERPAIANIFRISAAGGAPEQVPIHRPLDEFRCPLMGGSICVLREAEGQKAFVYYALDPITGQGRELARTAWLPPVVSDWTVAPDASAVALAIHDPGNPRIRIVPLNTAHRETELAVKAFGMLSGISWSADGKGWYVAADTGTGTLILYVNQQGESHVLRDTPLSSWGVPSPDGTRLAFVDQAVDSNVWLWQSKR